MTESSTTTGRAKGHPPRKGFLFVGSRSFGPLVPQGSRHPPIFRLRQGWSGWTEGQRHQTPATVGRTLVADLPQAMECGQTALRLAAEARKSAIFKKRHVHLVSLGLVLQQLFVRRKPSLRQRLHQRLLRVRVETDVDLGRQVVGQVEQLLASGDRHQQRAGSLVDGQLGDLDGVVDRVDGTAKVQAAGYDQATLDASLEQRAAEPQQDAEPKASAAPRGVKRPELSRELVHPGISITDQFPRGAAQVLLAVPGTLDKGRRLGPVEDLPAGARLDGDPPSFLSNEIPDISSKQTTSHRQTRPRCPLALLTNIWATVALPPETKCEQGETCWKR